MREPTTPPFAARLTALAAAAAALLRGAFGRRPTVWAHGPGNDAAGAQVMHNSGRNDGPPDLDELWRDFNKKLSGLFGGKGSPSGPQRGNDERPPGGGGFQPDMKSAGIDRVAEAPASVPASSASWRCSSGSAAASSSCRKASRRW
jgi:modulator of FtsH protease HflK